MKLKSIVNQLLSFLVMLEFTWWEITNVYYSLIEAIILDESTVNKEKFA